MNNQSTIIIVVVIILAALGLWVATSGRPAAIDQNVNIETQEAGSETTITSTTTTTGTSTSGVSGSVNVREQSVKTFTVTGSNFAFTPATMTVNKGDKVVIVFKNTQGTHDFKLDEFGVNSGILQPGAEKTIEFVADKAGSFEYYCSIGSHRQMGMKGTLIVR